MELNRNLLIAIIFFSLFFYNSDCFSQDTFEDKHIEVSLRMIGHEVLHNANDSISSVLPIEKENERYRIRFESEFEFVPEELVTTVNRIIWDTGIARTFILEVERCETGEVVYSFEMDEQEQSNIIPCRSRIQAKDCYSLLFTLKGSEMLSEARSKTNSDSLGSSIFGTKKVKYLVILIVFIIFGLLYFLWRRRPKAKMNPNVVALGDYQFNKQNSELIGEDQRIELSSKEAELLILLYDAVNTTLEREVILKRVWGDEGDYVGRTLDVFISKLRKKLEADPKVKIVNIRGVGYKLVMDV